MTTDRMSLHERWREAVMVGLIAAMMTIVVYAFLGFALTFKAVVEMHQRVRASLSRMR